jgi:Fe-S-cluster containining protein
MRPAEDAGSEGPGWEGEHFPLSEAERARLEAAAAALPTAPGKPAGSLSSETLNSPAFIKAMLEIFPDEAERLAAAYPAGGRHRRINLRPDGSCVCLTPQGCCLPREARPWFCRLFPLWVQRKRLAAFAPPDCLAVLESRSPRDLLRAFGASEAGVLELYKALRRDWGL